jgi:hypothetical protein
MYVYGSEVYFFFVIAHQIQKEVPSEEGFPTIPKSTKRGVMVWRISMWQAKQNKTNYLLLKIDPS